MCVCVCLFNNSAKPINETGNTCHNMRYTATCMSLTGCKDMHAATPNDMNATQARANRPFPRLRNMHMCASAKCLSHWKTSQHQIRYTEKTLDLRLTRKQKDLDPTLTSEIKTKTVRATSSFDAYARMHILLRTENVAISS